MSVFHGLSAGKIVHAVEPGVGVAVGGGSVAVRVGVDVRVAVVVGVRVGVAVETGGGVGVHVGVRIGGGVRVGFRFACARPGNASSRRGTSASTPITDTRDLVFMCRLQSNFGTADERRTGPVLLIGNVDSSRTIRCRRTIRKTKIRHTPIAESEQLFAAENFRLNRRDPVTSGVLRLGGRR